MPKGLDKIIEDIIDERMAEIASIRLHISNVSADRQLASRLVAMLIARLYSFLESGVKEIVNAYLYTYISAGYMPKDMRSCYIAWRYGSSLRGWIVSQSNNELVNIDPLIRTKFLSTKKLTTIDIRHEYSTMDAKAMSEVYTGCGLHLGKVESNSIHINMLCTRRHEVAHGRFLSSQTLSELTIMADDYRRLISELLYDLAYQCLDGYNSRRLSNI